MSVTVAEGDVVLHADMSGVDKDVKKGVDSIESTGGGSALKSGLGLGAKIVGGLAVATGAAIVGAVGTVAGTALSKGLDRALSIQDATAKLQGLGHSGTEVQGIMDNALASVKGTAFGLGDAATVAASAVAAGIQPGTQLTGVLKTIADTATIAGASMTDTGAIFNSVAARGKLQGDDLMQLQERGVPVLQFLAKHYGITAQAASDMVSNGQVDFANFDAAMQENLGGAALKSGQTARGAWANVQAALGRLGASFLIPAVSAAPGLFSAVSTSIDGINTAITPVVSALGTKLGGAMSSLATDIGKIDWTKVSGGMTSAFGTIGSVLGSIGTVIHAAFTDFMIGFGPAVQPLLNIITQLGPQVIGLASAFSPFHIILDAILPVLPTIGAALGQVATTLGGALSSALGIITPLFSQLASMLSSGIAQVIPMLMPLLVSLSGVFAQIVPVVAQVAAAIIPLAMTLISALLPPIIQLVSTVGPEFASMFLMIGTAIGPLVTQILAVLVPVIQMLLPIVSAVFSAIVPIIQAAMQIVMGVIQVVTGIISGNWSQVWTGIKNIFGGIWNGIQAILTGALNILKAAFGPALAWFTSTWSSGWNSIVSFFTGIGSRIVGIATGFISGLRGAIAGIGSIFSSIQGAVTGALAGAGSWLLGIGGKIIDGLVSGIRAAIGKVKDILGTVTNLIPSWKGPESLDKVLLAPNGRMIMGGLVDGINASLPMVRSALQGVTSSIPVTVSSSISSGTTGQAVASSLSGSTSSSGTGTTQIFHVTIDASNVKDFTDVVEVFQSIGQAARTGRGKG